MKATEEAVEEKELLKAELHAFEQELGDSSRAGLII